MVAWIPFVFLGIMGLALFGGKAFWASDNKIMAYIVFSVAGVAGLMAIVTGLKLN